MTTTEKATVPWGISVDYPVADIRTYLELDNRKCGDPAHIADLGCGNSSNALKLRTQLPHTILCAIDYNPQVGQAVAIYDGDLPIEFVSGNLVEPPNSLEMFRRFNDNEPFFDAIISNNFLCNIADQSDRALVAFLIQNNLKSGGYCFILDHLLKVMVHTVRRRHTINIVKDIRRRLAGKDNMAMFGQLPHPVGFIILAKKNSRFFSPPGFLSG